MGGNYSTALQVAKLLIPKLIHPRHMDMESATWIWRVPHGYGEYRIAPNFKGLKLSFLQQLDDKIHCTHKF